MATRKIELEIKKEDLRFTKQQIKDACKWKDHRDLIEAVFDKDKEYELKEIEDKIETFLKGKVN